ncbi:Hpt domain-containing protein [Zhengella sp. ZM62]|uniref:Hpt domain-containing protein n=1 Tax=Zhengella sedimenti TaxID=3390035 RepID=UPI003975D4F8
MAASRMETVAFDRPGGETSPKACRRPIDMDQLHKQTFGDRALEQEVLTLFTHQAGLVLETIATSDAAARKRLAHTLKGSARSIGASGLAVLCERLETAPTDRRTIAALAREVGAVRDFIASISR